jgi:hypothetical protein
MEINFKRLLILKRGVCSYEHVLINVMLGPAIL